VVLSGLLHAAAKVSSASSDTATATSTPSELLSALMDALVSDEMRASEHPAIRNQLLAVASNIMHWLGPRWESHKQNVLVIEIQTSFLITTRTQYLLYLVEIETVFLCRCSEVVQLLYTLLLQLYGFERESSRLTPIRQAMSELASSCGKLAFDELADSYAPTVMEAACSGADRCVSVFSL